MTDTIIQPIGGTARAFLRQVHMHMGALKVTRDEELTLAAECHAAGYLDHPTGDQFVFVITVKGIAYLDRLARCE